MKSTENKRVTITFTDIEGIERTFELPESTFISIQRSDGSEVVSMGYVDDALVVATHPDKSGGACIAYKDGALDIVRTFYSDDYASSEAEIEYKDGNIDTIQLYSPTEPYELIKGIYDISSGDPVCK